MPSPLEGLSPFQVRTLRDKLQDRLHFASWAAMLGGVGYAIYALVVFTDPIHELAAAATLAGASAMQFLLAFQVRQAHQLASASLALGYIAALSTKWLLYHDFSGALTAVLLLTVYLRGFLAAVDLKELEKLHGPQQSLPASFFQRRTTADVESAT